MRKNIFWKNESLSTILKLKVLKTLFYKISSAKTKQRIDTVGPDESLLLSKD